MKEVSLNFLSRQGHSFCFADAENQGLCLLFKCHCKKGYAASCMLWLGALVGQAKGCVQR